MGQSENEPELFENPLLMEKYHKWIITAGCAASVLLTVYGMVKGNHIIFILGIALVIGGYIKVRRMIKESIKKRIYH